MMVPMDEEHTFETLLEELKDKARDTWPGETGEERATKVENHIRERAAEYAKLMFTTELEVLKKWEADRGVNVPNYYQDASQPSLTGKNIKTFTTKKEFHEALKDSTFRCPSCDGESTHPVECDSGKEMSPGKMCDWKAYGLFGTMGKGIYVYVFDEMEGVDIFMPTKWEGEGAVESSKGV